MAARFSLWAYLLRLAVGILIVFGTYNPSTYSYLHWVFTDSGEFTLSAVQSFDAIKALVGVALLIGWIFYLNATWRSLGMFGTILAVLFFGLIFWLLLDLLGRWDLDQSTMVTVIKYMVLLLVAFVISTGVYWSILRRWFTGQVDVDDVEE